MSSIAAPEFVEVSQRDGLQNEKTILPTEQKIALVNRMVQAGARRIEVASFVNPARVPQMADAEAVVAGLRRHADVTYIGLALNKRGALRALEAGLQELDSRIARQGIFGLHRLIRRRPGAGVATFGCESAQAAGSTGEVCRDRKQLRAVFARYFISVHSEG